MHRSVFSWLQAQIIKINLCYFYNEQMEIKYLKCISNALITCEINLTKYTEKLQTFLIEVIEYRKKWDSLYSSIRKLKIVRL